MTEKHRTPIAIPNAPAPKGAYSPLIRSGDFVFVSGQVPTDDSGKVVGTTAAEQTRFVMGKLERALNTAGLSLNNLVSVTAYLSSIDLWDEFDAAYRACLEPPFPTRTTVGCQLHGVLVEISAIAAVPQT